MPKGIYKRGKKFSEIARRNGACRKNFMVSKQTREKISASQKGKPRYQTRGNKNGSWKGGITSIDQRDRTRIEFLNWRDGVFKVNKKECSVCGLKEMLVAHHIKSFKKYKELRYEIKNGVIVCRRCHPKIHKYEIY